MIKNIELFGSKVDYLIPPVLTAFLIFMFYGFPAPATTGVIMIFVIKRTPLRGGGLTEQRLALVVAGLALTFSLFLRSFFYGGYCYGAPWSVNAEIRQMLDIETGCFIAGGYLQYAFTSFTGSVRDI